jgi:hypothetical protein
VGLWSRLVGGGQRPADYSALVSEVLPELTADLEQLQWHWIEPEIEDDPPATTEEVADWVWVGYEHHDELPVNTLAVSDEVKGLIDTGLDVDEDPLVEALQRLLPQLTEVDHPDREVYYLMSPEGRLDPALLAETALRALHAANQAQRDSRR